MVQKTGLRWWQYVVGLYLVVQLDIAAGVIAAHYLCKAFGRPPNLLVYVVVALASVSPDISIPIHMLRGGKATGDHRRLTHFPLAIPIIFMGMALTSVFWATLVSVCLLLHFIDDTTDPGGLAWLWPFSRRRWGLGGESLSPREWLATYWLRPTLKSGTSVVLGVVAAVLVLWW